MCASHISSFSSIKSSGTLRIILDGIDQCEDNAFDHNGLIPWIVDNVTAHVLFLGRRQPKAQSALDGWPVVTLGAAGTTEKDLAAYSHQIVQTYLGDPVDEVLVQGLIKRADNMFLYLFFLEDLVRRDAMNFYTKEKRIEFGIPQKNTAECLQNVLILYSGSASRNRTRVDVCVGNSFSVPDVFSESCDMRHLP